MKELESLLKEIGFSEYETRTFLTLTVHGTCTADEISRLANIPLPRVYDTVAQLQKNGFVMLTKTRPQRCKANEIKFVLNNYLKRRKTELNKEIDTFIDRSSKLNFSAIKKAPKPPTADDWKIWTMSGKDNIRKMRHEFENKTKNEMLIFSGDGSFMKEDYEILEKLIKNDVKIRLILRRPENKQCKENIEKLRSFGVDVRTGYNGAMKGDVIDNKNVLSVIKYGKPNSNGLPGDEKNFSYEFLLLNNPVFVKIFKDYFELNWEKLK